VAIVPPGIEIETDPSLQGHESRANRFFDDLEAASEKGGVKAEASDQASAERWERLLDQPDPANLQH
jgi:hypothetical protein